MKTELFTVTLAVLCLATPVVGRAQHGAPTSAQDITPLLIGASVPDVTLQTPDGKAFNLKATVAKKPTVLIFYRGGWCPYCNTYLGQLQAAEAGLLNLGYQILAISPDRPPKLGESVEKGKLTYTLLSDSSMKAAQAFGIAFRVDDVTLEKYKDYGIDLEAASGEKHHLLPVPAVFIVGTDGVIAFVYANPNYKVRLTPEVLLAAAKAAKGSGTKHEGSGSKVVAAGSETKIGVPDISLAALKQAIADKAVVLLDCNGSKSYASGHIPGALDFESAKTDLAKRLPADKAALVVAYCGGPKCMAYKAGAEAATKLSYTNVKHFSGGISGWKKAGEKLETAALCPKCGQIKGSDVCCKADAVKCEKCGMAKGSPGCCAVPTAE